MKAPHGSSLYGTKTPTSDTDYKGIILPNMKDVVIGNPTKSITDNTNNSNTKNSSDDVDIELYSLKYFLDMACKGETICIDMIHTPDSLLIIDSPEWQFIRENRSRFYSKSLRTFIHYCKKQAGKYSLKGSRLASLEKVYNYIKDLDVPRGMKLQDIQDGFVVDEYCKFEPDETLGNGRYFYNVLGSQFQDRCPAEVFKKQIIQKWNEYGERARMAKTNEGVDFKAIHHALRSCMQVEEILLTGDLQYPLKEAKFLVEVKLGQHKFIDIQPMLEDYVDKVDKMLMESSFPDKADTSFWYDWCYEVYLEEIKKL